MKKPCCVFAVYGKRVLHEEYFQLPDIWMCKNAISHLVEIMQSHINVCLYIYTGICQIDMFSFMNSLLTLSSATSLCPIIITSSNGNIFPPDCSFAGNPKWSVDSPRKGTVRWIFDVYDVPVWTKCWWYPQLTGNSRRHNGHLPSP